MGRAAAIDILILDTPASGAMHGFAISEAIGDSSLEELEFHGVMNSAWGIGQDDWRAKYYGLRAARASHDGHQRPAAAAQFTFGGRIGSVPVFVNGAPATFVIDAASDTIVNSARLHLFVLHTLTPSTVTTSGSAPVAWNLVRIGQFTVGGEQIRKRAVLAKSLRDLEVALGQQVDGILGNCEDRDER